MPTIPPEQTVQAAFEHYFSDEGKYPRAVQRGPDGQYLLMSAAAAWPVWKASHLRALKRSRDLAKRAGRPVGAGDGDTFIPGSSSDVARDIEAEIAALEALGW